MPRATGLIVTAGLAATAAGVLLLTVGNGVPGLAWFGAPVLLLGLILLAVAAREARRPDPPPDTPESVAANLPGPWYPAAILVILAGLAGWFIFWTKVR